MLVKEKVMFTICYCLPMHSFISLPFSIPSRLAHTVEQEPMKSTVTFVGDNEQQEGKIIPPYVTRYSSRGFRIKDIKVFGSVAIIPDEFYHWKVS